MGKKGSNKMKAQEKVEYLNVIKSAERIAEVENNIEKVLELLEVHINEKITDVDYLGGIAYSRVLSLYNNGRRCESEVSLDGAGDMSTENRLYTLTDNP